MSWFHDFQNCYFKENNVISMNKICIVTDSTDDLIGRLKPLIDEIKNSEHGVLVTGVFYGANRATLIENQKKIFDEIYFAANLGEFRRTLKNQEADKVLAFIKHRPAVKDIFIYLMLKLTRTNTIYLRKNVISLQRYFKTNNDESQRVFKIILQAIFRNIILDMKLSLLFLMVLFIIWYRRIAGKLLPVRRKTHHKILLMRLDKLGDMVITYPYIKVLREAYPESLLTVLTSRAGHAFISEQQELEGVSLYDNIIVWDAPWHHGKRFKLQNTADFISLVSFSRKLWRENFDLVIQPIVFGTGTALAALTLGKKTVAAIAEGFPLANLLKSQVSDPVPLPCYFKNCHIEEPVRLVMARAGVALDTVSRIASVSYAVKSEMLRLLHQKGSVAGQAVFTVNVGTGKKVSRWSAGKFAAVCGLIRETMHANVVLVGGEDDFFFAQEVEGLLRHPVINLAGQLTLNQVTALMALSELVVTSDTGLMHMAARAGARIVALFGAGPVPYCKPLCDNYIIVKHELGCTDCGDSCFADGIAPCMEAITVEDVWAAIKKLSSHATSQENI